MLIRILTATLMCAMCSASLFAQDAQPDRINQILFDTKLKEMNIDVDQGNQQPVDVNSPQYKIGFKDGYKKAVTDMKASFGQAISAGQSTASVAPAQAAPAGIGNSDEWVAKSFQQLNDGHWSEGIEAASIAISLNPNNEKAYLNRAWGYAEKGLLDEAIRDANRAIELTPRNPYAYNNRAYAYELAGSLTQAKQDYKIACELNFKSACETVIQLSSVTAQNTNQQVSQLINQSFQKFQQKDWNAVDEISTRVLLLDPENAVAYVNRAGARTELGHINPAIKDCSQAIKIAPKFAAAYNNCGYAYELAGQLLQAASSYQQACNLGIQQSCSDFQRLSTKTVSN